MLVVDASFVIQASLTPDGLNRLSAHHAVAPALLWSEATSVLHEFLWRRSISAELADAELRRLRQARIRVRQPARLYAAAWGVSERLGWAKTYAAEYVALAQFLDCPLLTTDARLARTAAREVTIFDPADL